MPPLKRVIDCDLHNQVPSIKALFPYLPRHWREYSEQSAFKGPVDDPYGPAINATRPEYAGGGAAPGSSLGLVQQQALDAWQPEYALLNCTYAIESIHNPDAAAALASAVNDWQAAEWLDREPRLRASLVVTPHYPDLAAREIERLGGHPGFVQVLLPARAEAPYGNRRYHPIFAAAVRHNLVVGLHFGGTPGTPPTASGWPSYYIEQQAGMAHVFQSQIISLIAEGVFAQFPDLRVAIVESGFTWLPSLMWRMDKEWKGLRREIPWVREAPSELIRRHMRFTLQPVDGPPEPNHPHLRQIVEQFGVGDLLMFSSDYPHWHSDAPALPLPLDVAPELERKILFDNAFAFYRW